MTVTIRVFVTYEMICTGCGKVNAESVLGHKQFGLLRGYI